MGLPIFVYGTLMPGFSNYRVYLEGKTEKELSATTKGKMYDVGAFPAVVEGESTIKGSLIYIKDSYKKVLDALDELEGCLYTRIITEVFLDEDKPIFAWIYRWVLSTDNLVEIPSGDWAAYILSPTLELGNVYATPGVLEKVTQEDIIKAIARHKNCDWGEVCKEDWKENDLSLDMGFRILSEYTSNGGVRFRVITEADRSATTILLPEEY